MELGNNRRQSFRLNDTMTVRLRALDEESIQNISDNFNAFRLRYSLKAHMKNQREQRLPRLQKIKKSEPSIAQYLEYLEMLIVQLAERIDENTETYSDALESELLVNLSATGARFSSVMPTKEGQVLELGMMLSTIDTQVVVLAEVMRTEKHDDGLMYVSVRFTHIHQDDTEAIIRHLAKLQQQELRDRKAG